MKSHLYPVRMASHKREFMSQKTKNSLMLLVLVGLNMRPLLTSVGPLLPQLRAASGMSFALASLMTALPVVAMGVMALAGGRLNRHLNERNMVIISLLTIAAGALVRELAPSSATLLSSALIGGVGIGIIQATIPGIIKRLYSRNTAPVMGLWSAALMGGGGLGAALTPWMASHSNVWYHALAWWALPAILALTGWMLVGQSAMRTPEKSLSAPAVRLHFSPRAWTLGIYFGLINGGYTSLIAWLPPYYMQLGSSPQSSGSLLALLTLGQTAGALLMPLLTRHHDRRRLLLVALMMQLVGFCGFIWLPREMPVVWALIGGIGLGGTFPLSLVLALDHSSHAPLAGRLVAFMQGIGFIIAGASPYLSGFLRNATGDYLADWMFHAACVVGLMLLTLRFAPSRYPPEWQVASQGKGA